MQAAELIASRRRLLLAADLERQQLEARLREGPERRLVDVAETLSRVSPDANGPSIESLDRAKSQLSHALVELDELGRGLHPRDLVEAGLQGALASLAERTPIPVDLEVSVMRLPDEFEAAVYFVSAEALANVVKYASASRATLTVAATDHRLSVVVADDGIGDADPSHGTGLQGLVDRIEALGGTLQVDSPPGGGTRLTIEIPLDGAVRWLRLPGIANLLPIGMAEAATTSAWPGATQLTKVNFRSPFGDVLQRNTSGAGRALVIRSPSTSCVKQSFASGGLGHRQRDDARQLLAPRSW